LASNNLRAAAAEKSDSALSTIKLGVAAYSFYQFPLDQAIAMTQRVGLKHFCVHPKHLPITSAAEEIVKAAKTIREAGLDLYAVGVVDMKKTEDVDRAFEYAKLAQVGIINAMPTVDLLPRINEKVKQYDIRLAIHNHGPEDKQFPTPDVAYRQIKNFDPRVGLCIDIGHTLRGGVEPSEAAEQFADRLFDVHIKDIHVATALGRGCEAGRGVIDLPRFLRTLKKIRYSGVVAFEYEKDMHDPLAGLAESVGYVRGILAAI